MLHRKIFEQEIYLALRKRDREVVPKGDPIRLLAVGLSGSAVRDAALGSRQPAPALGSSF